MAQQRLEPERRRPALGQEQERERALESELQAQESGQEPQRQERALPESVKALPLEPELTECRQARRRSAWWTIRKMRWTRRPS